MSLTETAIGPAALGVCADEMTDDQAPVFVTCSLGLVDHIAYEAEDLDDAKRFVTVCSSAFALPLEIKQPGDVRVLDVRMKPHIQDQISDGELIEIVTSRVSHYTVISC